MNFIKKNKLVISLVGVLLLAIATIGTVAYFSKNFTSDNNVAAAAKFDVNAVNSIGQTIGNGDFNLGEDLYPGMDTLEVYNFQIKKNETELPVEYSVNLTPSGELFNNGTPIQLTLQRNVNDAWINVDYSETFRPESETESYKILVDWPHSDNDIDFQGKTGNIKLDVVATQVDPEVEEPEGPPYYSGAIEFKATPNGSTRETSNKELNFYVNGDGYKVIEVSMGDGDGTFEEKVGNLRIVESVESGTTWYRVYSDNEYYASGTQLWRVSSENIDTSIDGTLRFNKVLGPYLSIESKALYNWFTGK